MKQKNFSIKAMLMMALAFGLSDAAGASFLPPEILLKAQPSAQESNITEAEFNQAVSGVQDAFAPVVSAMGNNLSISGDWKSTQLNAGSKEIFSSWQVYITGAIARRPEMTTDAITLILCHEMGHHLGGFPFIPSDFPFQPTWAAAEGEADYFSTQVCPHRMWGKAVDENAKFRSQVHPFAKTACDASWSTQEQRDLCYRVSVGSEAVIATMAGIMNKPLPNFETPDQKIVDKTNVMYPSIQCRMDTLFHGDLCTASFDPTVIPGKNQGLDTPDAEREASKFSCMKISGFSTGLRPECWFKARL
jgi:hypothetical protein